MFLVFKSLSIKNKLKRLTEKPGNRDNEKCGFPEMKFRNWIYMYNLAKNLKWFKKSGK